MIPAKQHVPMQIWNLLHQGYFFCFLHNSEAVFLPKQICENILLQYEMFRGRADLQAGLPVQKTRARSHLSQVKKK